MPIRAFPFEPKHREAFNHVRSRVYRGGDPVRDEEDLISTDGSGTLVEVDGQIVGAANSIHYSCTFGNSALKSAGVAAVGVLPEARRTGAGTALMHSVNRQMRDEGFSMALLYPYSASFYRQFGYEYAGSRIGISCPSNRLPTIDSGLTIREIDSSVAQFIDPCYQSFAQQFNGMNHRCSIQWSRALGMDKPFTVFAAGDPVEAYALVRLDGAFWVDQPIRELVWSTPRGYLAMIEFFRAISANKNRLTWFEPSSSPWKSQFGERDVDITANQQIMWRVLDVRTALSVLTGEGNFTIEVLDEEFPENCGPWRVELTNNGAKVEPSKSAEIRMHVRRLAQALVGEPSFKTLAHSGLIEVDSLDALGRAIRAFGNGPGFCLEYF